MIKLTEYCLDHPTTTYVLTALLVVGGIMSYTSMGRLEDPAFTIKDALVITSYPGASAAEVEEEVTNEIEIALQKLSQQMGALPNLIPTLKETGFLRKFSDSIFSSSAWLIIHSCCRRLLSLRRLSLSFPSLVCYWFLVQPWKKRSMKS